MRARNPAACRNPWRQAWQGPNPGDGRPERPLYQASQASQAGLQPVRRRCLRVGATLIGSLLAPGLGLVSRPAAGRLAMELPLGAAWTLPAQEVFRLSAMAAGSLAQTLEAVRGWRIPSGSALQLDVPAGQWPMARGLRIEHPDGRWIRLVGDDPDPACTRLQWADDADAIYAGAGAVLGLIDRLTLEQTDRSRRGAGSGMLADEGGVIHAGAQLRIDGFYYGVQARRNGVVRCERIMVRGGGDANFFAFMGGHVHARHAVSEGADDRARQLGSGFVAEYGGTMDVQGAQAQGNFLAGFTALSNGVIRAYGARAEGNGRSGFYAANGGRIVAHDAVASGTCGRGVWQGEGGQITGHRLQSIDVKVPPAGCPP